MATNYMAAAALGTDDQSKALSARSVADSSRPSTPGWGYAQPKTSVNVIPAIGNVRAPPKVGINEANKESMYHQSSLLLAVRQGDVAEVARVLKEGGEMGGEMGSEVGGEMGGEMGGAVGGEVGGEVAGVLAGELVGELGTEVAREVGTEVGSEVAV